MVYDTNIVYKYQCSKNLTDTNMIDLPHDSDIKISTNLNLNQMSDKNQYYLNYIESINKSLTSQYHYLMLKSADDISYNNNNIYQLNNYNYNLVKTNYQIYDDFKKIEYKYYLLKHTEKNIKILESEYDNVQRSLELSELKLNEQKKIYDFLLSQVKISTLLLQNLNKVNIENIKNQLYKLGIK